MENLLDSHPEGLGKHITVYEMPPNLVGNVTFDDCWVDSVFAGHCLPILVHVNTCEPRSLLVVFGSDLTVASESIWKSRTNKDTGLIEHLLLPDAMEIFDKLKFYYDQMLSYLGIDKSEVKLGYIVQKAY